MDSKRRKISHDYNLRSKSRRVVLRPRTPLPRNDTDASTSSNQLQQSNQPIRDAAEELQQSKNRSRQRQQRGSTRRHRKSTSVPSVPNDSSRRHRTSSSVSNKNDSPRRHRKSPSASNKSNDDASDDIKCVICLDTVDDRRMKFISCGHSFHTKCCNNWLSVNDACPVCRTVVAPKRARVPDNRERIIDNTPISDIIYFFSLSVVRSHP